MSDEDKKRMESEGSRATAATTSVSRTRMAVMVFNAMLWLRERRGTFLRVIWAKVGWPRLMDVTREKRVRNSR